MIKENSNFSEIVNVLLNSYCENSARDMIDKGLFGNFMAILKDKELLSTAIKFIECNLCCALTTEKAFLHRNTLNYRLDKIKDITGLNLKKFNDAMCFKLLITLIGCDK
ncbi:MAG: helix-turn-helix domain-containing protein [Clostridia bacterium]